MNDLHVSDGIEYVLGTCKELVCEEGGHGGVAY